jgi:hypothetical protein
MLQGTDDTTGMMLITLVVLTLLTFVVLGVKFFVSLFEVVTAPGASLKHLGTSDTAFYSFAVVFLGHLIGSIVLVLHRGQMSSGFHDFSTKYGEFLAAMNSNKNYQDVAASWASNQMNSLYQTVVDSNLLWLGLYGMALWILAGLIFFVAAKMFGSPLSLTELFSATAYPMFFYTIGFCCYLAGTLSGFGVFGAGFSPDALAGTAVLNIVGAVLCLYALILYAISFIQVTDLGFGQLLVGVLLYLLIIGGAGYLVGYKVTGPAIEKFSSDVSSIDFSKDNYRLPGQSSR